MEQSMAKPKWWTETYDKMTSPLEKLQYLNGLSGLSWEDCQDAWFESNQLMPKIAEALASLEARVKGLEAHVAKQREHLDGRMERNGWYIAENARLRKALETARRYIEMNGGGWTKGGDTVLGSNDVLKLVDGALNGTSNVQGKESESCKS